MVGADCWLRGLCGDSGGFELGVWTFDAGCFDTWVPWMLNTEESRGVAGPEWSCVRKGGDPDANVELW
jgi:hypothetical protein